MRRSGTLAVSLVVSLWSAVGCYRSIVTGENLRPGALESMLERAENARGIRADSPIDVRVVTAADLAATVRQATLAQWDDDALDRYTESLVTIGLWPSDQSLLDQLVGTLGAEAAGLYVPEDRSLYVVRDPRTPVKIRLVSAIARRDLVREYALAHELVHFLQHQAWPALFERIVRVTDRDDTVWAAQAAIEGDAVRYGFAAVGIRTPTPVDFRKSIERSAAEGLLANEPALIQQTIVFPYVYGYRLAMLEATLLLADPPASTEQVLHLDKRHESFSSIELAVDSDALPAGCERLWSNTVGELGFSILFRELSEHPDPDAWIGWDGDRYVAARCNSHRGFVWLSTWDSVADATEFAQAYRGIAAAVAIRAGLRAAPRIATSGKQAVIYTESFEPYAANVGRHATIRRATRIEDVVSDELVRARISRSGLAPLVLPSPAAAARTHSGKAPPQ